MAFAKLSRARPDVTLEIVGDNRTHTSRRSSGVWLLQRGAADRITLSSYVSRRDAATRYTSARRAFVFLSEYEGFGLTPLEALAAGVPIVVLDTPVAREVYRDAASTCRGPMPTLVARGARAGAVRRRRARADARGVGARARPLLLAGAAPNTVLRVLLRDARYANDAALSIVIVTYNSSRQIDACLQSTATTLPPARPRDGRRRQRLA